MFSWSQEQLASINRRFADGFTIRSHLDRYDVMAAVAAGITGGAARLSGRCRAEPVRPHGRTQVSRTGLRQLALRHRKSAVRPCGRTSTCGVLSPISSCPDLRARSTARVGVRDDGHPSRESHRGLEGRCRGGVSTWVLLRLRCSGRPGAASDAPCVRCDHSGRASAARMDCAPDDRQDSVLGPERTVAELSRWMYIRGYDTWHLPALAAPVLGIEAVLRGYLAGSGNSWTTSTATNSISNAWSSVPDGSRICPRYEVMGLIARGVGCWPATPAGSPSPA